MQPRWPDTGHKLGIGYMEFDDCKGAQADIGLHTVSGKELMVKPDNQVLFCGPIAGDTQYSPIFDPAIL